METLNFSVSSFLGDASLHASMHQAQRVEGKSVPGFDCTFEEDFCGWTQAEVGAIPWVREQASNRTNVISGPTSDHTFGNSSGFYAVTKLPPSANSSGIIKTSVLISPRLPGNATAPMCFSWWYMMQETSYVEFKVYWIQSVNDLLESERQWQRKGHYGRRWQYAELQIEPSDNVTCISYEATGYMDVRTAVSIDDVQLIEGPCVESTAKSIACTFEDENACGYSTSQGAKFLWTRMRAISSTFSTGPIDGNACLL